MKAIAYFRKILPDSSMSNLMYCTTHYRDTGQVCEWWPELVHPRCNTMDHRTAVVWVRGAFLSLCVICCLGDGELGLGHIFVNICVWVHIHAVCACECICVCAVCVRTCVCVCVCGCGQILCQKIKSGYNAVCNKCFICYIVINFKTLFPSKQNFVAQHFTILKNTCFKMFASEKKKGTQFN